MEDIQLISFLMESNKIEDIHGIVPASQMAATKAFLALDEITIDDLIKYVSAIQPDAILRDKEHLNVRVGNHYPIKGGSEVRRRLQFILDRVNSGMATAFECHLDYEDLHPFTDGNGRSGRMLWLWQMGEAPLGFLHKFYYQTLQGYR